MRRSIASARRRRQDALISLPRPHVPIVCSTMWAITDFTADNGATGWSPARTTPSRRPTEMPRGSILIFNGSIWHGGGANLTAERRVGVALNYCAGWIRQQENQQLGIPLAVARNFSPRLRRLAGSGLYKRLLGPIDRCSPEDLLDGSGPRRVVGEL